MYSLTLKSIGKVEPFLRIMMQNDKRVEWETETPDQARKLHYNLNQALAAAIHLKYPPYDKLREKFDLGYKGRKVYANPKDLIIAQSAKFTVRDVVDAFAVVAWMIKNKNITDQPIYFQDFVDRDNEMSVVKWATNNGYLVTDDQYGIILTKKIINGNSSTTSDSVHAEV